jgi:hypothetical protein
MKIGFISKHFSANLGGGSPLGHLSAGLIPHPPLEETLIVDFMKRRHCSP